MKLKFPNVRILEPSSNKFWLTYFYLSEPIQKIRFTVRHPVFRHQLPPERKMSERESENDGQPLIFFARQGKKVLNMRPLVEKNP